MVSEWSINPSSRTGSVTVCQPELTCEAVDLIDWTRQDSLTDAAAVAGSQHSLERSASGLQIFIQFEPFKNGDFVASVPVEYIPEINMMRRSRICW